MVARRRRRRRVEARDERENYKGQPRDKLGRFAEEQAVRSSRAAHAQSSRLIAGQSRGKYAHQDAARLHRQASSEARELAKKHRELGNTRAGRNFEAFADEHQESADYHAKRVEADEEEERAARPRPRARAVSAARLAGARLGHEHRSEREQEAEANIAAIEPHYLPLWEKERRRFKGDAHERYEQFVEYADAHPDEVARAYSEESERKTESLIRSYEGRSNPGDWQGDERTSGGEWRMRKKTKRRPNPEPAETIGAMKSYRSAARKIDGMILGTAAGEQNEKEIYRALDRLLTRSHKPEIRGEPAAKLEAEEIDAGLRRRLALAKDEGYLARQRGRSAELARLKDEAAAARGAMQNPPPACLYCGGKGWTRKGDAVVPCGYCPTPEKAGRGKVEQASLFTEPQEIEQSSSQRRTVDMFGKRNPNEGEIVVYPIAERPDYAQILADALRDDPGLSAEDAVSVVRFAQWDFEATHGGPASFGSHAREATRADRRREAPPAVVLVTEIPPTENPHRPPTYREAHWGISPTRRDRYDVPDPRDNTKMLELGEFVVATYGTKKGKDRRLTDYFHTFERKRPMLCYGDVDGKLYVVGGDYRVEDRGIVG